MSERDYLIAKALPSALRNVPKGTSHNPYIAARVYSAERGKTAGKMLARSKAEEKAINAKWRPPLKVRRPVTAPLAIAGDEVNRFYAMQAVRESRGFAHNIKTQGGMGRRISRERLAAGQTRDTRLAA
jgi:hypothetical protein